MSSRQTGLLPVILVTAVIGAVACHANAPAAAGRTDSPAGDSAWAPTRPEASAGSLQRPKWHRR
jgi:hypothetical protein